MNVASILNEQTPTERLQALLAGRMDAVGELITARMASEHAPRIPEVTQHLVGAGGKRLRPMLTLAAAHDGGAAGDADLKLAAAVEFIHTATLLHDDVVDESKRRRGRPTANLLWDNKSSVLVGDYLFSRAFQLMVETGSLRVLDILANASATIAEGEVLQMTAAGSLATDQETYLKIVRGKTAALFAAATEAGALVGGGNAETVEAYRVYGDALGIAFQVVDDLLDYGGADGTLGKDIGDDFREGKITLPIIHAVAAGNEAERAFWVRCLEKGDQREGDLEEAMALMTRHGALEKTRDAANDWASRAETALAALPQSETVDILRALSGHLIARVN